MNVVSLADAWGAHLHPLDASASLVPVFTAITHMGDARAIAIVGAAMAYTLARHRRYATATALAVSLGGALACSYALKLALMRPRPLYALIETPGYSLPSMHAAVSTALYGFLMYMTYRYLEPRSHRAPWIAFLAVLALFIGVSRVYLGVHYASDVLAGFGLGALWVAVGISVERIFSPKTPTRRAR